MNCELPDVQAGFRKGRGTRDQIANICWIIEKPREFQKNIYFCFIDYAKASSKGGEWDLDSSFFDLWILKPFVGRRTELSVIYPGIIKLSWIVWRAVLIRKQKVTLDVSLSYLLRSPVSMRYVSHIKSRFNLTVQFEWQPCCNLEIYTYGSCDFFW